MRLFYPVTIVIFLLFTSNAIIHHLNPKSAKSKRLACHQQSTTFERLYAPREIKELKEHLAKGDFKFKIHIAKSHYMSTRIDSYMSLAQFENILSQIMGKANGEKVLIDVLLYENDKDDPKKKTDKAKLYEGYVQVSYYMDQKRIYTVQIDYMDREGKDISKRLECAKRSLESL